MVYKLHLNKAIKKFETNKHKHYTHYTRGSGQCSEAIKINKKRPGWKGRSKMGLCRDNMFIHIEDLLESTQTLPELTNGVAGDKINIQKSVVFL